MGIITGAVKKANKKVNGFITTSLEKEEQKCWLYDETPFCRSIT